MMAKNDSSAGKKYVVVDEAGRRIGESHPRARLTEHEIALIAELAEDEGLNYQAIAKRFEGAGRR